ncbi:COX15/CtaA family protein [Undibacterium sp. SXout7W]|uniref:COX15/CtaA family protein n=1 Tax=Undibacterium sp. SXout7W TaxID=3413049 RepID=UPI003BF18E74
MFIQLAMTGLLVALLPLSIIFFSAEQNKYRKLVTVTMVLTFELIMFGAFTRLTDSGLGCPDWPGCYGQANPLQSHEAISAAEVAMPHGPVTLTKAWIEMVHRYLAMSVGVLIIVQLFFAWTQRSKLPGALKLAGVLLFAVCLQGAFGAWTVTLKLQPVIVTTHLLLGIILLALLAASVEQQRPAKEARGAGTLIAPATVALLVIFIQIALGGWVSTNYAALACHDYPLCNGKWLPDMDMGHGFSLWRPLGQTRDGMYLPFTALVAIQWVHRSFAVLVLGLVAWVGWKALAVKGFEQLGKYILMMILLQFLIGVSTVYFSWPLLLAVLHNGGAAMLVLLLTMLNYRVRHVSRAVVH